MRLADFRGAVLGTKLMIVERWFGCALRPRSWSRPPGRRLSCPLRDKKPTKAEPARKCDIAGNPGVLAANGVCVRLSGYISSQVSGGNLRDQYK